MARCFITAVLAGILWDMRQERPELADGAYRRACASCILIFLLACCTYVVFASLTFHKPLAGQFVWGLLPAPLPLLCGVEHVKQAVMLMAVEQLSRQHTFLQAWCCATNWCFLNLVPDGAFAACTCTMCRSCRSWL